MYGSDVEDLKKQLKERDEEVAFLKNQLSEVNFRLERLVEQAQYELKLISKIQHLLVPTEFPNISGFEFSTKFVPSSVRGGDYFDVFDVSEKMRFGVVMSCASGYAMSALLMSVLMKFSGFQLFHSNESVEAIVAGIKGDLEGQLGDKDCANLFFGLVDRRTHRLQFSLLGDIAAFYVDRSSGEVELLDPNHGPIGAEAVKSPKSTELSLNPKDRLVLCSTGILETESLTGEPMTIEKLKFFIKSAARSTIHELRNEVLFQVEKHTAGGEVKRDRTIVVVEVKDRVIKLAKG